MPDIIKPAKIWQLFKDFKREFWFISKPDTAFFTLVAVINAALESWAMFLIWPLIGLVIVRDRAADSFYGRFLTHHTSINPSYAVLFAMATVVGVYMLKNIFVLISTMHEVNVFSRWKNRISMQFFDKVLHAPFDFHNKRSAADVSSTVIVSIPYVINNFVGQLFSFVSNVILSLFVIGIILLNISPYALVGIGLGVAIMVLQHSMLRKSSRAIGRTFLERSNKNYAILSQTFAAFKEVHMFQVFERFSRDFKNNMQDLHATERWVRFHEKLPALTNEVVMMVILLATLFFMTAKGGKTDDAFQTLGILVVAFFRLVPTLNQISTSLTMLNSAAEPLQNLLATAYELDASGNRGREAQAHGNSATIPTGEIAFGHVTHDFYPGHYILKDVSFTIKPGALVALIGASGSGKSTLLNMLMGFIEPDHGHITAGGTDIQQHLFAWRKRIAIVMQDFYILNASLAENVAFGQEPSLIDEDRVCRALDQVELTDVYTQLDKGIWNSVGENGKLLSGGQRQRLALARALYFDKDIWILDEATSALDIKTEHQIMTIIQKLKGQITIIMAAHRFSVFRHADQIIMLKDGVVIGDGSYNTLSQNNIVFQELVHKSQTAVLDDPLLSAA